MNIIPKMSTEDSDMEADANMYISDLSDEEIFDMDEIVKSLMEDETWNLATNDLFTKRINVCRNGLSDCVPAFLDYEIKNCSVKRIQNYYIVRCPYCNHSQYRTESKPTFDSSLKNCNSRGCRKIFIY